MIREAISVDLELRKAVIGIEDEDVLAIKTLWPYIRSDLTNISDEFYAHIMGVPSFKRIIEEYSSDERLKELLPEALEKLFEAKLDQEYIQSRLRIGLVHYKVGLSLNWFISAYHRLVGIIRDRIRLQVEKEKGSIANMERKLHALNKFVFLDIEIVSDAYIGSYTEQLKEQKRAAERANRAKSDFLANMSHELRTPLNSIINFTELVRQKLQDQVEDKYIDRLGRVIKNADNLLALIEDVLNLSKIEAGKIRIQPEKFSIPDFVDEVRGNTEDLISKNQNTFQIKINPDAKFLISDRFRVSQILLNLLSNASKFTERGLIRLDVYTTQIGVGFAIEDTGIGISEGDLKYIFEKFRQLDSSLARRYQGSGLGLSICQKLTDLLGGKINIESELGKGTRFEVLLPNLSTKEGGNVLAERNGDEV